MPGRGAGRQRAGAGDGAAGAGPRPGGRRGLRDAVVWSRLPVLGRTPVRVLRNAVRDLRHGRPLGGVYLRRQDYSNSDYELLARCFEGRIRPGDVLVDIGSGRGRVLNFWLDRAPGHRIVGIESDPAMAAETARRLGRHRNVTVVCADATRRLPEDGTLFYMFNPFEAPDVARLAARLRPLAAREPGLRVLYYNPKHVGAFADAGWSVERVPLGPGLHDLAVVTP